MTGLKPENTPSQPYRVLGFVVTNSTLSLSTESPDILGMRLRFARSLPMATPTYCLPQTTIISRLLMVPSSTSPPNPLTHAVAPILLTVRRRPAYRRLVADGEPSTW